MDTATLENRWFQPDYTALRAQFVRLAQNAGGCLERHGIEAAGPGGEPLAIDVARIGPDDARKVLVVASGTHGVEGPAGSAIQAQVLGEDLSVLHLPKDAAVVLIHAVNPFGFAWQRRQNENNVDLNRNFLDWSRPPPERPVYAELDGLLNPLQISSDEDQRFNVEATRLLKAHGLPWLQARVSEGQYAFPQGLYYGGAGPEASNLIVREVLDRHLARAAEGVLIDLHTGMGAFGDWIALSASPAGTEPHAWLQQALPPARLSAPIGGAQAQDKRWPAVSGGLKEAAVRDNGHCDLRAFTLEFGTYDEARTIRAERLENWAHHWGDRESEAGRAAVAEHAECFAPASPIWRARLLAGGRAALYDVWRGLFGAEGFSPS